MATLKRVISYRTLFIGLTLAIPMLCASLTAFTENFGECCMAQDDDDDRDNDNQMLPIPSDEQLNRIRATGQLTPPGRTERGTLWSEQDLAELEQNPPIPELVERGVLRFNPAAYEAWLRAQPQSTHVEDRRREPLPPDYPNPMSGYRRDYRAQGGLVDMPGYYQRGGLDAAPKLGIPQMDAAARDAHFGGLNLQHAILRPSRLPAVHVARPPAIRPMNFRPANLRGSLGPAIRPAHIPPISARPAGGIRSPGVHLIHSSVPGRVDRIPMHARTGSYVIPADVVSGLGQGNTYAGAKMWGQAIAHAAGPYGVRNTIRPAHMRTPALRMGRGQIFARGGANDSGYTPIVTAGGECLVDPEMVTALGNGDAEHGKKELNDSVMRVRKQVVQHMRSLPPPVK